MEAAAVRHHRLWILRATRAAPVSGIKATGRNDTSAPDRNRCSCLMA